MHSRHQIGLDARMFPDIIFDMSTRDQLLHEMELFIATTGMKEWQLGKMAVGDSTFFERLRNGTNPRTDTLDRMRAYMRDYRNKTKAASAA